MPQEHNYDGYVSISTLLRPTNTRAHSVFHTLKFNPFKITTCPVFGRLNYTDPAHVALTVAQITKAKIGRTKGEEK